MKTFQLTLTAMLLLGLTAVTVAQDEEIEKNIKKTYMMSAWNGDEYSTRDFLNLFVHEGFREGLGISQEQVQKIHYAHEVAHKPGDVIPFGVNVNDEILKRAKIAMEAMNNAIKEILTPDQKKKVKAFQISAMSFSEYISPGMFEVLDLSAEQMKQLDGIKKTIEPEYEKYVDKVVDVGWIFFEKYQTELKKLHSDVTDPIERRKMLTIDHVKAVEEKVKKSNPALVREMDDIRESGEKLADSLKIKMFDVLTDEQWNRMVNLIDNPPDYVKKILAERREREKSDSSTGVWQPGPNSWKPGDPIPEGYRQQRQEQGRFPRNK